MDCETLLVVGQAVMKLSYHVRALDGPVVLLMFDTVSRMLIAGSYSCRIVELQGGGTEPSNSKSRRSGDNPDPLRIVRGT